MLNPVRTLLRKSLRKGNAHCSGWAGSCIVFKKENFLYRRLKKAGDFQGDYRGGYESSYLDGADGFARNAHVIGERSLAEAMLRSEDADAVLELAAHGA